MITKIHLLRFLHLAFLLFFVYANSIAQKSIGIKSGLNFSKQQVNYIDGNHNYTQDKIDGYEFGVNFRTNLFKNFELISELNILQKGGGSAYTGLKMDELELAFLVAYQIPIQRFAIYANAGGFLGYVFDGKFVEYESNRSKKINFDFEHQNRWDSGVALGGGVKYNFKRSSIILETRYRYSLTFFRNDHKTDFSLIENENIIDYYRVTSRFFGMNLTLGYNYQF